MATARSILVVDGHVLFLRRKRTLGGKHLSLHWCLPGGVILESEDPWECARRETGEETGFRCTLTATFESRRFVADL